MLAFDTAAHTILCHMFEPMPCIMQIFVMSRNDDLNVLSWAPFVLRSKLYNVLAKTDDQIYLCARTIPL